MFYETHVFRFTKLFWYVEFSKLIHSTVKDTRSSHQGLENPWSVEKVPEPPKT